MGNFFGQPEETNEYPDTLDQVGILKIIELLGTVSGQSLENNPAPITDSRFNSDCALASHLHEITVKDPEILNHTLEVIADHLIQKLSSDEKAVEVFPKETEMFLFKCGHLGQVRPDREGFYQDFQVQEYVKRDIGGVDRIKRILRGFSVYQFKNEGLIAISRTARVPIEDVFVGTQNGEFITYAPRVENNTTDSLKITWWVYELDDGSIIPLPGTGGGVSLNEKNTINVMDLSGLRELTSWARDGNENSLERYDKWSNLVREKGECWALCSGDVRGDLVELEDFFDRVDNTGDVFDKDEVSSEEESEGEEPPTLEQLSLDD